MKKKSKYENCQNRRNSQIFNADLEKINEFRSLKRESLAFNLWERFNFDLIIRWGISVNHSFRLLKQGFQDSIVPIFKLTIAATIEILGKGQPGLFITFNQFEKLEVILLSPGHFLYFISKMILIVISHCIGFVMMPSVKLLVQSFCNLSPFHARILIALLNVSPNRLGPFRWNFHQPIVSSLAVRRIGFPNLLGNWWPSVAFLP